MIYWQYDIKRSYVIKNIDFTVTKEQTTTACRFIIEGFVNSRNAPEIQHRLDEALSSGETNIILNMSQVKFLSSAGIRLILKTHKDTAKVGGSFGIEDPSESVRNVLYMTALDEMLI